jgi:lipopolysaccharide export system protein LptA
LAFLRNITFLLCLVNVIYAQEKTQLEIINADYTFFDQQKYPDIRRLVGNVIFNHNGAIMNCDSAWYYFKENRFEAFSNIHINQGDTMHLFGKKLNYNGQEQKAIVKYDIVLKDKTMKLLTDEIHYFLETNVASYYTLARITNRENVLISDKGDYISESKLLIFKDNVSLSNPNYLIICDTLHFNTESEIAYFFGPTTITSDDNLIYCENGWYNTLTDKSQFNKNAYLWSDNQKLSGDSLYYDRNNGYGLAINNIQIQDTANDYSIYGNKAEYFEKLDSSIITDSPLLVADFEEDTLFLHSDTIVANLDSLKYQQIKAFTMANFYSENLQGKSQELFYFMRDSTIQLFESPILWSDEYQLTSDHIILRLKDNNIDLLEMQKNAFIISKDSLGLYNQIKGKDMTGYFKQNELQKINVKGNGQTVYVIKDEKDKITGINTISCSQMNIGISDKNINRISFQTLPNSIIFPIEELPNEWKRLEGFKERFKERISTKEDIWND